MKFRISPDCDPCKNLLSSRHKDAASKRTSAGIRTFSNGIQHVNAAELNAVDAHVMPPAGEPMLAHSDGEEMPDDCSTTSVAALGEMLMSTPPPSAVPPSIVPTRPPSIVTPDYCSSLRVDGERALHVIVKHDHCSNSQLVPSCVPPRTDTLSDDDPISDISLRTDVISDDDPSVTLHAVTPVDSDDDSAADLSATCADVTLASSFGSACATNPDIAASMFGWSCPDDIRHSVCGLNAVKMVLPFDLPMVIGSTFVTRHQAANSLIDLAAGSGEHASSGTDVTFGIDARGLQMHFLCTSHGMSH